MLVFTGTFRRIETEDVVPSSGAEPFVSQTAVCEVELPDGKVVAQFIQLAGKSLAGFVAEPGSEVSFEVSVQGYRKKDGMVSTRMKAWRLAAPVTVGAHAAPF